MAEEYALECKSLWCDKILSGQKSIESRRYPLPPELLGRKLWLLASSGEEGRSLVPNNVPESQPGLLMAGWVIFSGVKEYKTEDAWGRDRDKHCVPLGTPYSWKNGGPDKIYGWEISHKEALPTPQPNPKMRRKFRSIFTIIR